GGHFQSALVGSVFSECGSAALFVGESWPAEYFFLAFYGYESFSYALASRAGYAYARNRTRAGASLGFQGERIETLLFGESLLPFASARGAGLLKQNSHGKPIKTKIMITDKIAVSARKQPAHARRMEREAEVFLRTVPRCACRLSLPLRLADGSR
ncbi:MAG: hypothetical protein ACLSWS_20755, partial [Faecalispora jeddahensis]